VSFADREQGEHVSPSISETENFAGITLVTASADRRQKFVRYSGELFGTEAQGHDECRGEIYVLEFGAMLRDEPDSTLLDIEPFFDFYRYRKFPACDKSPGERR
jgi:hypothetical protein